MPRSSKLCIDVRSVGDKDGSDARVVKLRGHLDRRLPVGPLGRCKSGTTGDEIGDRL
jgi:hypothetical protein